MDVLGTAVASRIAFFVTFIMVLMAYFKKKSFLKFTSCKVDFKKITRFFYNGLLKALVKEKFHFEVLLY
ncbi:MAG: hypothetical protein RSD26_05565 [Cellulosilyticaceae bacterium]